VAVVASCVADERARSARRRSAEVLAFQVANGYLPAVAKAQAELQLAEGGQSLEREAKCSASMSPCLSSGRTANTRDLRDGCAAQSGAQAASQRPDQPRMGAVRAGNRRRLALACDRERRRIRRRHEPREAAAGVWALVLFHDSAAVPRAQLRSPSRTMV